MRLDDPAVATVRDGLRERDLRTIVLAPRPASALLRRRNGPAWHEAAIDGGRWRLDELLAGSPWIAVATVDAGGHTAPFALDLPARFLHPADRIRLVTRPERLTPEVFDTVEALERYAEERGATLLEVAIGGLLAMPAVASVIAGATKPEQARANAAAGAWEPGEDDLDALSAALRSAG